MSRFFSSKFAELKPYVPGEQPRDMKYIKLNTNESPFPPSDGVIKAVTEEAGKLQIYSDPDSNELVSKIAELYGVKREMVIVSNGSDEILDFAFMAFSDDNVPAAFADITYGFYPVYAQRNNIKYEEVPLKADLTIDYKDYIGKNRLTVIANPNAHTGLFLSLDKIEAIISSNPDNVVIVDEAYVDFGAESAVKLTEKYDNLLVVQTFSKSRSLAGARLGFAIGSEELIADLNTIRFSTNPYNVNRMTSAAGCAAIDDNEYYMSNCRTIAEVREYTKERLTELGFEVTDSKANFVFAKTDRIDGGKLYTNLKERGILIRHFSGERIKEYNRITIGRKEDMDVLLDNIREILEETDGKNS